MAQSYVNLIEGPVHVSVYGNDGIGDAPLLWEGDLGPGESQLFHDAMIQIAIDSEGRVMLSSERDLETNEFPYLFWRVEVALSRFDAPTDFPLRYIDVAFNGDVSEAYGVVNQNAGFIQYTGIDPVDPDPMGLIALQDVQEFAGMSCRTPGLG